MFLPDGWDARVRVGLLVPHADVGPESEIQAMAPEDVYIHASRVYFGAMRAGGKMDPKIPYSPVRAFTEPPHIDDSIELLAAAPVDVIACGFTSSSYVLGPAGEREMFTRLAQYTRGLPIVGTCSAAVRGLTALDARRIAIVNPPWFDDELDRQGEEYFAAQGFDVVSHGPSDLPSDQQRITPNALLEWVRSQVATQNLDAVFIAGNGIRSVGVIAPLEEEYGFAVMTANQVLLWEAIHAAGESTKDITSYGRLFGLSPAQGSGE